MPVISSAEYKPAGCSGVYKYKAKGLPLAGRDRAAAAEASF